MMWLRLLLPLRVATAMSSRRCSVLNLLVLDCIPACEALYNIAKKISMSLVMQEALIFVVSEDICRREFKTRSHYGLVVESHNRQVDYGNYLYGVLYNLVMFYGCRHSPTICTLYKQAKERYPTLDMEAPYTRKSLIMQGDVMEVALAIARHATSDLPQCTLDERKTFMQYFRRIPVFFNTVLYWIDNERDTHDSVQVSWRPPSYVLARAILLAVPAVRVVDDDVSSGYLRNMVALENHRDWPLSGRLLVV